MKSLVWQQNCHEKVCGELYIGGIFISAVGLHILKFVQTSLFYSDPYFKLGVLELCFGGAKPTKDPPVVTGLCGKTSACFLMQFTRKST